MAEAIVCGAGAAGLAAAATLQRAGVPVTIVERSDRVGASWRGRYDGLRLNTPGWMSTLPGYRATRRRYGEFPTRDDWVRYLEDYTDHHRLDIRFGIDVRTVAATGTGWRVETHADGDLAGRFVVIATGYDRAPDLPDWAGRDTFTGELMHSSAFRAAVDYRGRDVLVVGPNTTGSELACFLARAGARVRLACRTPPNLTARKFLGLSINVPGVMLNHAPLRVGDALGRLAQRIMFGDLTAHGLPRSPEGVATTLVRRHQAPAYDDGFVSELKAGRIGIVGALVGFEGADVLLADGTRIQPEVVIAATGYRRGLEQLVGHLGVLDHEGIPLVNGGQQHPSAPGLFFNGFRADLSGQLRLMRGGARGIARAVRRYRA